MKSNWNSITAGKSTPSDVVAAIGRPDRDLNDVKRGSEEHLRMLDYNDRMASIYLKEDKVVLIVFRPRPDDGFPATKDQWVTQEGNPEKKLQSTRGKNAWIWLYAAKGYAGIIDVDRVLAIELFVPMTTEDYEKRFYQQPSPFTK